MARGLRLRFADDWNGDRAVGRRWSSADASPRHPRSARRDAGNGARGAADPLRPRRDRGLGGQRLLVGQHEAEPCARARWASPRGCLARDPRQLRPLHKRADIDAFPRRVARTSPRGAKRARHDLSRLSGDARRSRPRSSTRCCPGSRRSSPIRIPRTAGPRGGGGGRGRARAGRRRSACTGGSVAFTGARPRRSTGRSRERSSAGRRIVTLATEHAAVLDTVEWLGGHGRDVDGASGRARRAGRSRRWPASCDRRADLRSWRRCWSTTRSA